jgi:hypothetical protein
VVHRVAIKTEELKFLPAVFKLLWGECGARLEDGFSFVPAENALILGVDIVADAHSFGGETDDLGGRHMIENARRESGLPTYGGEEVKARLYVTDGGGYFPGLGVEFIEIGEEVIQAMNGVVEGSALLYKAPLVRAQFDTKDLASFCNLTVIMDGFADAFEAESDEDADGYDDDVDSEVFEGVRRAFGGVDVHRGRQSLCVFRDRILYAGYAWRIFEEEASGRVFLSRV